MWVSSTPMETGTRTSTQSKVRPLQLFGGRLTDLAVKNARARDRAYKKGDGRGLCLLVQPNGAKWWRFRYRWAGKEQMLSLGTYPDTSLADARKEREKARQDLANDINPADARRTASAPERTFEAVARHWLAKLAKKVRLGKRSVKTLKKATWALETYVFPLIGTKHIGSIESHQLLAVLKKIEDLGLLETARRTRQRCGQVLRHGIGLGYCSRDITVDLRGLIEAPTVTHHAGLTEPVKVGGLLRDIDNYTGRRQTVLAMKLSPLTFVRPMELRMAEREAFDLEAGEWRVSRTIMKMKVEHVVPLSRQAIAIVREALTLSVGSQYLFPCLGNPRRCMSENTVNDALRRLGYETDEQTAQGIRVMASTLLNEQGWPPDAIEKQLAHIEENEVREVYNQAKYLPVRRQMMQFWADYLDELRKGNTAAVKDFEKVAASHSGPRALPPIANVRHSRLKAPDNENSLCGNTMEFATSLRFSIGAPLQITGIGSAPTPRVDPTPPGGRSLGENVEVERSRRDNGTFTGHDLSV